jgi:aromatic-L-amino-acid/L-tryptophan decarboxylase
MIAVPGEHGRGRDDPRGGRRDGGAWTTTLLSWIVPVRTSQPATWPWTSTAGLAPPMAETGRLPGGWAWDDETLRAAAHQVADLAADHLVTLPERPVFAAVPGELAARWRSEEWAADGVGIGQLLAEVTRDVLRYPFGNGHPRFHAWVNSPPDRAALLLDLLASATDPSCAGGNHAALHIERLVIRWLAEMACLPATAGGLLVSGGSLATVTALAAARQAHAPFDPRVDGLAGGVPLTVYVSTEVHSAITKAVELLGIGRRNLRLLSPAAGRRLDAALLDRELEAAGQRPEHPIAVVASAGTTSTGAIDPLDEIADVCARHNVWLHVDGAYGAPAILSDRYRAELAGLARADSIAIDPHKWLYVPVDAGALLVRDPGRLRDTFSLIPPYLRVEHDPDGVSDAPWVSECGPEQTRPFRALRVWAALKSTGRDGYRRLIEHDLGLADTLAAQVRAHPSLELDAAGLSVVCFRYRAAAAESDRVQSQIAQRIQLSGQSFLTTTELDGRTVLRTCFINPLTTDADIDALIGLVAAAGEMSGAARA